MGEIPAIETERLTKSFGSTQALCVSTGYANRSKC